MSGMTMCPGPYKNAPMASGGSFWLLLLFLHWPEFKWAACKKRRIKQPRQGEGGTDDAPSLCTHTRMTRLTTRTTVPKIGNVAEEVVGMDGMVVQGGAREWRGKAAR